MGDESKFGNAIEQLTKVREQSGVEVGGKLYSMVKDRIELFRRTFGSDFGIRTSVDWSNGLEGGATVIGIAQIIDRQGNVLASGHSMERVNPGNDVSWNAPVEAVETKAIGRALACFGFHGGEYASDAEMIPVNERRRDAAPQRGNGRDVDGPRIPIGQKKAPPEVVVGDDMFVPHDYQSYWDDPEGNDAMIKESLKGIGNGKDLAKYWSALEGFRDMLKRENRPAYEKLASEFVDRNAMLGGDDA